MKRLFLAACLAVVAGSAHAQERGGMASADLDHDGKVTVSEFKKAQAERMISRLDTNKDGKISKAEMNAMQAMMGQRAGGAAGGGDRMAAMFDKLDTNKDGVLSHAEIEAGAKRRFDMADTNHDGWLSKGELLTMRQNRGRAD
jgi:Ca2+-binding EF-hand superfamily protein